MSTLLASVDRSEAVATREAVGIDRALFLQAAIVRVMKARKVLSQQLLIAEVVVQARSHFAASVPLVKKCIVQLIEKDFLEVAEETETGDQNDVILKYI